MEETTLRTPDRLLALLAAAALTTGATGAAAAGPFTAETPVVSGGGEASGLPRETRAPPPGPSAASRRDRPPATPFGAVGSTFDGFGYDDNTVENGYRAIPPDPIGAAGPDRLLAVVNSMIEARNKSGSLLFRDGLSDFFAPSGCALAAGPFDPKVVYDHHAGRFLVVALERANAGVNPSAGNLSRILLAVSKTASPATATAADWWYHCIDGKISSAGLDHWADYPGFEVDEEAVYITANLFTFPGVASAYLGSRLWIVRKGTAGGFYAGGAATVTLHNPYTLPSSIATTTMPAEVHGAGGIAPGVGTFLVSYSGLSDGVTEYVQVVRVDDPLGVSGGPSFVGPDFVALGNIETLAAGLPDAPQPGSGQLIEVNDRRALDAVARGGALWLVTTINPDGPALPGLADHTTAHWVRLSTSAVTSSASPAGLLTLADQGSIVGEELAGPAGGDVYTYFPSVAVNSFGTAAFGFSASGINVYAGAFATVRRAADPAGTTDPARTIRAGVDHYARTFDAPPCDSPPARNRWGDYSGISVDPANDRGFWVYNQFADLRGTPSTGGCNGRPDPEDGRWGTAWGLIGVSPTIALGNVSLSEGNAGTTPFNFTLTLSEPTIATVSVTLTTVDGTAISTVGDYVAKSATVNIPAGSTAGVFTVTVNGDVTPEPNETFTVTMSNPVNGSPLAGGGIGTILNDDGTTDAGTGPVAALALRALTPSPGPGPARLEFDLPEETDVDLSVLDVAGHRVARLAAGRWSAGRHRAVWESAAAGRRAPAGVYFVRLSTPVGERVRRLVLR